MNEEPDLTDIWSGNLKAELDRQRMIVLVECLLHNRKERLEQLSKAESHYREALYVFNGAVRQAWKELDFAIRRHNALVEEASVWREEAFALIETYAKALPEFYRPEGEKRIRYESWLEDQNKPFLRVQIDQPKDWVVHLSASAQLDALYDSIESLIETEKGEPLFDPDAPEAQLDPIE